MVRWKAESEVCGKPKRLRGEAVGARACARQEGEPRRSVCGETCAQQVRPAEVRGCSGCEELGWRLVQLMRGAAPCRHLLLPDGCSSCARLKGLS